MNVGPEGTSRAGIRHKMHMTKQFVMSCEFAKCAVKSINVISEQAAVALPF